MSSEKVKWLYKHWKQGVHILLHTKRFGVNNRWWSDFDSFWGVPMWKIAWRIVTVYPLIKEYKRMKVRATDLGFLHPDTAVLLWGEKYRI